MILHPDTTCKYCGSSNLQSIRKPADHPHYAELRCVTCDKHQKWLPKPLEEMPVIDALQLDNRLTAWERSFLANIRKCKNLTATQKSKLDEIQERLTTLNKIPLWD